MTDASHEPHPPAADDLADTGARPFTWQPGWPVVAPAPRRPVRPAAVFVTVGLAVSALGAPLGWLWAVLAPTVPVRMTEDGAILTETQPEEFVAAEGWFAGLGLAFGVLAAIGVWLVVRRWRGPLMLFAVSLGSIGAGQVAWRLGRRIGIDEYERLLDTAAAGTVFGKPADLRSADADLLFNLLPAARGTVLVPAFAAAVAYTLLAGWSRFASLRPDEPDQLEPAWPGPVGPPPVGPPPVGAGDGSGEDGEGVSWDWTGRPTPPVAPAPPAPGGAAPPPG